ncbi:uncharacterized protein TNCV_4620791 [Trichonephila clavipes]|nr:uncharacterized protein TNCV_4620791 [Trichonephila clavipes]
MADKLEAFDNIRRSLPSGTKRHVKESEAVNDERQVSSRKPDHLPKREYSHPVPKEISPLRFFGCEKLGVIKSRCPNCNPSSSQRTYVATNHINAYSTQTRSPRLTLIGITFCGIKGRVCADTGSSHSVAGERMCQVYKDKGLLFQETTLAMSLADGQQITGTDFLSSASLVQDVKNACWYFWDNPTHKYAFGAELDTPSIAEKMSSNTFQLRGGGRGEATTILEHHINTGTSPPISVSFIPVRKRGRPPKVRQTPGSSSGPEREDVTNGNIYYLFTVMTARWCHQTEY